MSAEIVQALLSNPVTTLFTSLALAGFIVLFDVKTGISYNIPGPGRLGLAGIIAGAGSIFYFFARGGLSAFAGEIAAGIFGALVTGVVIAKLLNK
jgi:hypothetical protein